MEPSKLNFDTELPLSYYGGDALHTQLSMYDYPCLDAEVKNWTLPTIPHNSPPVVFSWQYMPMPFACPYFYQPSAGPRMGLPSYQIINTPYQTGSFCHGEWLQNFTGAYPRTDYGSSNLKHDPMPQQLEKKQFEQGPDQYHGRITSSSNAEHFETNMAEVATSETQGLNCLRPEEKFLVDCKLEGMKGPQITAEYNKRWKPKTASALRTQLWRLTNGRPSNNRVQKTRSRKAPRPS
ncbi:hypothetical protein BFJ66_g13429 [Fusarium oxysporum f. sp. cepae]|uniref:Uncharacterized protein n=1 Tax=Fusarium oxysporum f. sp. cepae TaxID=396571 RepID=A0A3L6MSU9_FUSOX|nr:hypothetical protein BFJ65_g17396 [Fusarium oxysporum f. sp. cepae]RKK36548.1 hypothetical protein BFJ66_g13429 [Fusarium oxysporum f. sp. cepae]RKK41162.1 hypothetical protein BFJ67_g10649 [Fusarium oxysporum f. sp. cepae]